MKPYYYDEHAGITIYHGDCREVLPLLSADVLVTDPPYGINHSSHRPKAPRRGAEIKGDGCTELRDEVLQDWVPRPAVVFGSCSVSRPDMPIRAVLVWDKGGHVGMGDLSLPWKQNWEHIYISGQGFSGRRDSGVLHFSALQPVAKYFHPNEKPVNLFKALILKCPEGAILDPFMGSGTTLRAAKDLGRKAIGVEIEERYCEIAAKRLAQGVFDFEPTKSST